MPLPPETAKAIAPTSSEKINAEQQVAAVGQEVARLEPLRHLGRMRRQRAAHACGLGILQLDLVAVLEQLRGQRPLAWRKQVKTGVGLAHQAPAVLAAALVDLQETTHAHVHDVGGKAQPVVAHAPQHAQFAGRKALRRVVAREDGTGMRIATDTHPAPQIEDGQQHQARQADQHAAIVAQEPAESLRRAWARG